MLPGWRDVLCCDVNGAGLAAGRGERRESGDVVVQRVGLGDVGECGTDEGVGACTITNGASDASSSVLFICCCSLPMNWSLIVVEFTNQE